MVDLDKGQGDITRFPAEELEKLYKDGDGMTVRILGKELNKMLKTNAYESKAWYVVTAEGEVRKL